MPKSVKGVMHEFDMGTLHSGSKTGQVVTNRKQAIAIAVNEQKPHRGANLGRYLHPKKGK